MTSESLFTEDFKADTANATGCPSETLLHHFFADSDRLEDLGSLIAGQGGNPHLCHHLEDALLCGLPVRRRDLFVRPFPSKFAVVLQLPQGFEGHVRIDCIGTISGQQAEVMHLASFARFDNDPDPGSFFIANKMMMNRSCRQQCADR